MKFSVIILCLCLLILPAMAQEETLVSDVKETGGFGGPILKFSSIDNQSGIIIGGQGGVIYNKQFTFGGGFFVLSNLSKDYNLHYGGVILEYIKDSDKLTHFTFGFLIGAGEVEDKTVAYGIKKAFVVVPEVKYVINFSKKTRIGAGVSYRYMSGSDISDEKFNGPELSLTFKFGNFSK